MTWKLCEIQTPVSINNIKHSCTHSFTCCLWAASTLHWQNWVVTCICGVHRALHCCSVHHKSQWGSYNPTAFWLAHMHIGILNCDSLLLCITSAWPSCQNKKSVWCLDSKHSGECGLLCYEVTWESFVFIMQWHCSCARRIQYISRLAH